ncbi:MAG: O-antigen ligase family protein [Candidatus Jordarchaeaceae archaeon]
MFTFDENKVQGSEKTKLSVSFVLLAIYLAFIFFEPQQFFQGAKEIRITYYLGIIVISWGLLFGNIEVKKRLLTSKIFLLSISFFGLCTMSLILNEFPIEKQIDEINKVFSLFLMVPLLIRGKSDINRLCWLLMIFVTIITTISMFAYHLALLPTRMVSYFRALGASGSNEFGLLMAQLIPFPIIMLRYKGGVVKKGFLLFSFGTYLYCLTRTHSRSAFLGTLLVLCLLFLKKYLSGKYLLAIILVISVLLLKTPYSYFERISTIIEEDTISEDGNVVYRIDTNRKALKLIEEHPLLGIGIINYFNYYQKYLSYEGNKFLVIHNTYLQIGAEAGIPALIVFLLIIFLTIKRYWKNEREFIKTRENFSYLDAVSFSILGYCLIALFQPVLYNRLLYIFMGLAVVLERKNE